jgi:hypothetical protein
MTTGITTGTLQILSYNSAKEMPLTAGSSLPKEGKREKFLNLILSLTKNLFLVFFSSTTE